MTLQQRLTLDQIVALVRSTPEQALFDWKRDFETPTQDESKGETVKDVTAMANATAFRHTDGYLVYGVNPTDQRRLIVGISASWDDAKLQQLVRGTTEPPVEFLYYEVETGMDRPVAIIHVPRTKKPFHMITRDVGKLRAGQYLIRDGSHTRAITPDEQKALYYTYENGYLPQILEQWGLEAQRAQAQANLLRQLTEEKRQLHREMAAMVGLADPSILW
jgi:hypothetical protein